MTLDIKLDSDLEINPDPNTAYKCTPLRASKGFTKLMMMVMNANKIRNYREKLIRYLENNPLEINKKNDIGMTALMLAAINSKTDSNNETVKLLLQNNANVNARNRAGGTALMYASRYNQMSSSDDTVKLLLEYHADTNIRDNEGWTALTMATRFSNGDNNYIIICELLKNNANVNIGTNTGYTPIMLCLRRSNHDNNHKIIKLLLNSGAHINFKNKDDETALFLAIRLSNDETVQLLLENKADTAIINKRMETPLMSAVTDRSTKKEIKVLLLLEYGATDYAGLGNYVDFSYYINSVELIKLAIKKGIEFKHVGDLYHMNKDVAILVDECIRQRDKTKSMYKNIIGHIDENYVMAFKSKNLCIT